MSRLFLLFVLAVSLVGCSVDSQNSDRQKNKGNGPIPRNGMTATEQQNYGAGKAPQKTHNQGNAVNNQNENPNHTNNLTNPSPTKPNPQASEQNARDSQKK